MSALVVRERPPRESVRTLREFEGRGCLWRLPVAAAACLVIRAVPIVAAVAIALVTVEGRVAEAVLSAVIALAFDGLSKRLRRRMPWRAVIDNRLSTFERPHPASQVPICIPADQIEPAQVALRRATFNPRAYVMLLGSPPADAPYLRHRIGVEEPEAWPQSESDEDRVRRMAEVLRRAGLRARVAGIDVFPGGVDATDRDGCPKDDGRMTDPGSQMAPPGHARRVRVQAAQPHCTRCGRAVPYP